MRKTRSHIDDGDAIAPQCSAQQTDGSTVAKSYLQSRCMVHKVGMLMSELTEAAKDTVRELGFGSFVGIKVQSLQLSLIENLISRFDPDTLELNVHGKTLVIQVSDVEWLLGLHAGGESVESKFVRGNKYNDVYNLKREKLCTTTLHNDLKGLPVGQEYKAKMFLYLVSTIIRPTTATVVSGCYLPLLEKMEDIPMLNWAQYALEGLVSGIKSFKQSTFPPGKSKRIGGCVWILQMFYLERVSVGIVHGPLDGRVVPRCSFWTEETVSKSVAAVAKIGDRDSLHVKIFACKVDTCTPIVRKYTPLDCGIFVIIYQRDGISAIDTFSTLTTTMSDRNEIVVWLVLHRNNSLKNDICHET